MVLSLPRDQNRKWLQKRAAPRHHTSSDLKLRQDCFFTTRKTHIASPGLALLSTPVARPQLLNTAAQQLPQFLPVPGGDLNS